MTGLLEKFYRSGRFETILGAVGIGYLLILGVLGFFLVRFLTGSIRDSFQKEAVGAPTPVRFELDLVSRAP